MVIEGVDYSTSVPSAAALKAAGKHFVCRYGGKGTTDKMLTATEANRLRAAGIDIVANVEGVEGGFNSYAAGANWALAGLDWFKPLGLPDHRPIYFSVDVGSPNWAGVRAACQGAASVIGLNRVGIYGGYNTIAFVHDNGLARWFWQTYAWSTFNGTLRWHPAAHIQQYHNGVSIGGRDCDLDRAMVADYGQWGYEGVDMDWDDPLYEKGDNATDNPGRRVRQAIQDVEKTDGVWRGAFGLDVAGIPAGSPLGKLLAAVPNLPNLARIDDIEAKLDGVTNAVAALGQQQAPVIPQEQLDLAVLNALKTLAAGA